MAKSKTKAKVVKSECCGAPCGDYKPRLYLSLEGQDVSQIKDVAVGDEVEVLVTGKVVGLSQRERPDHKDGKKTVKTGDIDLEGYRVRVLGDEENEFTKMADEMDEDD